MTVSDHANDGNVKRHINRLKKKTAWSRGSNEALRNYLLAIGGNTKEGS